MQQLRKFSRGFISQKIKQFRHYIERLHLVYHLKYGLISVLCYFETNTPLICYITRFRCNYVIFTKNGNKLVAQHSFFYL